jgi:hypothetical protein
LAAVVTGWRKSSYSNPSGNCVAVWRGFPVVQVRDTKDPRPVLKFSHAEWNAFVARVKEDRCGG